MNPIQENSAGIPVATILTGTNIDEIFTRSVVSSGITSHFLTDALGSTIALADSSGTVSTEYTHDPYGEFSTAGLSNSNSYLFTGKEDDATGLDYFRARYYSPAIQRFIAEDPIQFGGGSLNLYSYVDNNPIKYTDPLGLYRNPFGIFNDATNDALNSGLPDPHNGLQDAYRHCLASCISTKENGAMLTQFLGWLNEKRGDWTHNQEQGEREMDDFNNACGIRLGGDPRDCKDSCMNAAISGQLKTYNSGSTPGYFYRPDALTPMTGPGPI